MSLATRCAACGTVFRVVQDQLKVSEGWVRCGRCGDVFNALDGLFDLERESAPAWTPSQRGALELLPANADEQAALAVPNPEFAAGEDDGLGTGLVSETAEDTQVDTRADSRMESNDARQAEPEDLDDDQVGRGELSDPDEATEDSPQVDAAQAEPTPAFLREADRAARWERPHMRVGLAVLALLLGLLLAAQAALWQRDALAARWPQASSLLALLCEPLACRVEPLRRLDGLVVESSGLIQLGNASMYRLQVALRNRDAQPLLTPALDVTLTDSRGEVVSRKVLQPRDLGESVPQTVAANGELSLQAVLDAGERRITGYSIEIFYP
jgi:predicted Zn finger-like uncharacterized protein